MSPKKSFLMLGGVLLSFLACLMIAEGVFYFLNLGRPKLNPWERKFRTAYGREEMLAAAASAEIPTRILESPILKPGAKSEPIRPHGEADHSLATPPGWGDSPHPPLARAGFTGRSKVTVKATGETVYDVPLSTDSYGRRRSFVRPGRATKVIAVFGDSQVFGVGIGDDETLPSQIARKAPGYLAFNYGVSGGSPRDALVIIEDPDFVGGLPRLPARAIYLLGNDDPRRIRPSISNLHKMRSTYYEEGARGELEKWSSYFDAHPFCARFLQLLSASQILKFHSLDVPFTVGDRDLRTTAKMLKRMADDWEERFHNRDFVVVFSPYMGPIRLLMKRYLDAFKVPYLDYGLIKSHERVAGRSKISEYEGHATPAVYEFLARHIVMDLSLAVH